MHVGWCEGMGVELSADVAAKREAAGPCQVRHFSTDAVGMRVSVAGSAGVCD
jgi:hypothetical protein